MSSLWRREAYSCTYDGYKKSWIKGPAEGDVLVVFKLDGRMTFWFTE